jgi:hypothetical protein
MKEDSWEGIGDVAVNGGSVSLKLPVGGDGNLCPFAYIKDSSKKFIGLSAGLGTQWNFQVPSRDRYQGEAVY